MSKNFTQVGRSVPRLDAPSKVKGEAIYTDDMVLPRMAYGKIKRSPYAHALIKSINYSKALRCRGFGSDYRCGAPNKWGLFRRQQMSSLAVTKSAFTVKV